MHSTPAYEVRPRKNKRGVDLISDALPFAQSVTQSFSAAHNML
jgi:hypothetical protein